MQEEFKLGYFEKKIRTELINFARCGALTTYQRLCDATSLQLNMRIEEQRKELAEILDDISIYELLNKRPPLSAIVELAKDDKSDSLPGSGFFKLCKKYDKQLKEILQCEKLEPTITDKKGFAKARQNECFLFWKDIDKYKTYKDIPQLTKLD